MLLLLIFLVLIFSIIVFGHKFQLENFQTQVQNDLEDFFEESSTRMINMILYIPPVIVSLLLSYFSYLTKGSKPVFDRYQSR